MAGRCRRRGSRSVGSCPSGGVRPPDCQASPEAAACPRPASVPDSGASGWLSGAHGVWPLRRFGPNFIVGHATSIVMTSGRFVISTRCVNAMRLISPTSFPSRTRPAHTGAGVPEPGIARTRRSGPSRFSRWGRGVKRFLAPLPLTRQWCEGRGHRDAHLHRGRYRDISFAHGWSEIATLGGPLALGGDPADASLSHGAAMTIDIPARISGDLIFPLPPPTPTWLGIASAGSLDLAPPPRYKLDPPASFWR